MRLRIPAKVNLFLRVVCRRPDGYHELESVFQSISLWDTLILTARRGELRLTSNTPDVPIDERNLVLRAARALRALPEAPAEAGAAIELRKEIPVGAGMGGGSADAAAALVGLARLWNLPLTEAQLAEVAAGLGSDVPFFLRGGACLARGRGEILEPLPVPAPWGLVLVKPPFGVSTPQAYAAWQPASPDAPPLDEFLAAWRRADLPGVARALRNDLEAGVVACHPEIEALRQQLLAAGAAGARMTGSGSAVFGLVETEAEARRIAGRLAASPGCVFVARCLTAEEARPAPEPNAG